jgi:tRNA threonylcarbamoyl adenosine modification protein (Sua5/YciO/YrdC/YwlC family)
MTEYLSIHPQNPQPRLVSQAAAALHAGGLIVYPTDSCYAFGFSLADQQSARRIERIRETGKDHNFTLLCRDLSEISAYARVENWMYRLLKAHTPGPYTFIFKATRDVPRRLQNPKRRTIGIRVPAHPVPEAILGVLAEPIMSSTLLLPDAELPLNDPAEILQRLEGKVDLIVDSGACGIVPTTVIDLTADYPVIVREGKGDTQHFR